MKTVKKEGLNILEKIFPELETFNYHRTFEFRNESIDIDRSCENLYENFVREVKEKLESFKQTNSMIIVEFEVWGPLLGKEELFPVLFPDAPEKHKQTTLSDAASALERIKTKHHPATHLVTRIYFSNTIRKIEHCIIHYLDQQQQDRIVNNS